MSPIAFSLVYTTLIDLPRRSRRRLTRQRFHRCLPLSCLRWLEDLVLQRNHRRRLTPGPPVPHMIRQISLDPAHRWIRLSAYKSVRGVYDAPLNNVWRTVGPQIYRVVKNPVKTRFSIDPSRFVTHGQDGEGTRSCGGLGYGHRTVHVRRHLTATLGIPLLPWRWGWMIPRARSASVSMRIVTSMATPYKSPRCQ